MPENVGKIHKKVKNEKSKDFDKTIRRTSSKIPRPNTPINKPIDEQPLACIGEDVVTKNEGDSSFLQLYITKVYLIQDALNKKKVSVTSENPNINNDVIELAEKITNLCHKINDVESHMYIGSKNANPKIEFGPGGDIDMIESTGSRYLGKIFENNYFHKDDDKYANTPKTTKNALNATTSQLFSPSEFSISNMFTTTNIEKSNSFPPETKSTGRKPEMQNRSTNNSIDRKVSKTLDALVTKTEDIMGRISLIDLNVKQLHTINEDSQTNEICEYCKKFSDELSNQKQQIKYVVDTLQEFVEQYPNINHYQDEFDKLSCKMQNVLQNTEDIRLNINISKRSSNQNSIVFNKNDKMLKKNYSDMLNGPNVHYCFENDYLSQQNQKLRTETDFRFVGREFKLFKKFMRRNRKRKHKKMKCLPNEIGNGSKTPQNKNKEIQELFSYGSKPNERNLIGKVCSMCSISSKKSKISNKNKNLTKNISSDKNNLNGRSFRNLDISESLKLNEDCRITENESELNISDTSSKRIIWNNQMKNSQKVLRGVVLKKTKSDQTVDAIDGNVISSDKYAEIVMELNTIISQKANKSPRDEKTTKNTSNENIENDTKHDDVPHESKRKNSKLKSSILSFKKNFSTKCVQVPSHDVDNSQESFRNVCKCTQIDNLDLLEKACLCRLCGCKTNHTFKLDSKSSVANYLCQLLNKSLKCDTALSDTNCIHVNVPLKESIKDKDTVQEIFIKNNTSSKSLSKRNSNEKYPLDLEPSQISLNNIQKTFSNKKLYKYFIKKKYVDENSKSGIVEYQENNSRKTEKLSMFSSKSKTKLDDGATTKQKTLPSKNNDKNKYFKNTENVWNTDSNSSGKSYTEFINPYKANNNLDILYSAINEPHKLKSFGYESVSLFDQPSKESEIIKQKVELKDILNKNQHASKKSIYTSSSLNGCVKNNSSIKYTNSDVKKLLESPRSLENKYILCISNKMSDIQKLQTMGLNPIEVNEKILNTEKKLFSLSTKDVNLINKNQNKNDKNNEFIKSNLAKNKSFLAAEFNSLLTEEVDKIFDNRKKFERLHTNSKENVGEFLETSGEKDGRLNSRRQTNTKKSFFKRLLGKRKK